MRERTALKLEHAKNLAGSSVARPSSMLTRLPWLGG